VHHLWADHASDGKIPELQLSTWIEAFVSRTEEVSFGIDPESTKQWRDQHDVLESDDINAFREQDEAELPLDEVVGSRRGRSATGASTSSAPGHARKQMRI
jgi:hypothetical protein